MRPTRRSLSIELLEDRLVPVYLPGTVLVPLSVPRVVVGAGVGGAEVRVYDASEWSGPGAGPELLRLTPFGPDHTGGVNVATADLNGDTIPEVVAGMASGGSQVKVFDGQTGAELLSFEAFDPSFTGGVNVAVGRTAADGGWGIVVGAGAGGGPHVKVFDAKTGEVVRSFFAFAPAFRGGVSVAAGDMTYDGTADVVVGAGPGGGPHVQVFDGVTGEVTRSVYAYTPSFTGGVNVAVTSLYSSASIVVSSDAPGQPVGVLGETDGPTRYVPFVGTGARVAVANFLWEGTDALTIPQFVLGAAPGGGPHVQVTAEPWSNLFEPQHSFFAFDPGFAGGVSVAAASRVIEARPGPVVVPAPPPVPVEIDPEPDLPDSVSR